MTIAPIVRSVSVKASPAKAFELFTTQMAHWWPKGRTIGKNPHVEIVLQPRVGGPWFERDADGAETQWGKVLAWERPPASCWPGRSTASGPMTPTSSPRWN